MFREYEDDTVGGNKNRKISPAIFAEDIYTIVKLDYFKIVIFLEAR